MSAPTPEQQAVLDSKARIRVVRAVPGSGKTWLVAELIKQELAQWQPTHGAIAALSFTRVGGKEIRRAVGYDLQHPHFVGTLDAFLFRFIVRPFLKSVFPSLSLPRLIPAAWEPKEWQKGPDDARFTVSVGNGDAAKVFKLFNVCFLGEDNGKPIVASKQRDWDPIVPLDPQARTVVLNAKKELWKKHGWLTHSDAAFLASKILGNQTHGPMIRSEMLRRFRLVIVDELQDTGWFLGQCVLQLLAELSARGVLVGDPDQAIYEFNGARPDLFDRFTKLEGTAQLPLGRTLRCGPAICVVAEHLTGPNRHIEPAPDRAGHAFLLSFNNLEADVRKLRHWLVSRSGNRSVKIVARHIKTVEKIAGKSTKEVRLGSTPLNHLHRAVKRFRQGQQTAALAAARAALEHHVFGNEGISDENLIAKEIDLDRWKRLCVESILEANSEVEGETFEIWGRRVADFLQRRLTAVVATDGNGEGLGRIRQPANNSKTKVRQQYLPAAVSGLPQGSGVTVQTVHAVKGETHDTTVFVTPEAHQENRCPSVVWWSNAAIDQEERRIAFVAATRTRGDLIVCVSEKCLARLQQRRADFVRSFECMSIDEFVVREGRVASGLISTPTITPVLEPTDANP